MAKVLAVLVVVFLGFWMYSDAAGLADFAQSAGSSVWNVASSLFTALAAFLGELTS